MKTVCKTIAPLGDPRARKRVGPKRLLLRYIKALQYVFKILKCTACHCKSIDPWGDYLNVLKLHGKSIDPWGDQVNVDFGMRGFEYSMY